MSVLQAVLQLRFPFFVVQPLAQGFHLHFVACCTETDCSDDSVPLTLIKRQEKKR